MSGQFDLERQELFCPYDGKALADSKWEFCRRKLRACPNGHIWDIGNGVWGRDSVEFRAVTMGRCECGRSAPRWDMKPPPESNGKAKPICPDCYQVVREAWRPDKELSIARLVISPIKTPDGVIFEYREACEVRPYPNPYGQGGFWGGGSVKTPEEVPELIARFKSSVERWQKLGVKVEIIRNPEMSRDESYNQHVVDQVAEGPKAEPQLRLV